MPPVPPVPSRHRIATTGSAETHWWEYGSGHSDAPGARGSGGTIVLVHGFRGTHDGLAQIAAALSRLLPGWSIALPDLPGFGRTPPPEAGCTAAGYQAWIRQFCAAVVAPGQPFVLLGHSFGTIVAALGMEHGLRPDALVLINPITQAALDGPHRVGTRAAIALYALAAHLPERAAVGVLSARPVVRVMSEAMAKTHDRDLRRWIHAQHDAYFSRFASSKDVLAAFRTSCERTVAEARERMDLPVLILCGDRDDIVPIRVQRAFAAALPDARLRVYTGVGHLIHYEAPQRAADDIAAFVTELTGGPDGPDQDGR